MTCKTSPLNLDITMKRSLQIFIQLVFITLLAPLALTAQVKVAVDADLATPADPSAILDVVSNEKGFLPPRLTTTERNGITAPAEGLTVFNTTENCINVYNGTAWETYCTLRYSTACSCVEYLNDYGLGTQAWIPIDAPASDDHDWYEVGTTAAPNAIGDNIFTEGNIGVGIPAPAQRIHTIGNVRADGRSYFFGASQRLTGDNNSALHWYSANSTVSQLLIRDAEADQYGRLYGSGNGTNFGLMDANGQWVFLSSLGNSLSFRVSNSEKVRITTAGNVGIGTTAPTERLDVFGEARIRTLLAGGSGDDVVVADASGVLRKLPSASFGDHDWYEVGTTTAPDNIADDIFTEGTVRIGNIPTSIYRLDVDGQITSRTANAFRMRYAPYSIIHRIDANRYYQLITNSGDQDGSWNTLRPYFVDLATGNVSIVNNGIFARHSDRHVGININLPTAQLDVNGDVRIRTVPAAPATDQLLTVDASGNVRKRLEADNSSTNELPLAGNDIDLTGTRTVNIEPILDFVSRINSPAATLIGTVSGNTIPGFTISRDITKFGYNACPNLSLRNHVIVGDEAGFNISNVPISSSNLVMLGFRAGYNLTSGNSNTFLGHQAGHGYNTGDGNVSIGYQSGWGPTAGNRNVFLGYRAGYATGNLTNSIAIGYNTNVTATNRVRIGNTAMNQIGGQVGWSTLSDARFKSNIVDYEAGLDFILKLRPVQYQFEEEEQAGNLYHGFLAQEVEATMKELGIEFSGMTAPVNENDRYSLRYAEFTIPLVNAAKEQQKIIEAQQTKIESLEARLKAIEAKLK